MRGVRPLVTPQRAGPARRGPLARARFARPARAAVLRESREPPAADSDPPAGDVAQFRQAGVPESALRQLRRGQIRIDAEIDLHGLRLEEARVRLREFLLSALAQRWQGLRIVHGKGLRSGARGPVI